MLVGVIKSLGFVVTLATDDIKIMQKYISSKQQTIFFLDIVIEKDNNQSHGLTIANQIIAANNNSLIVFVTDYIDLVLGKTLLQIKAFNMIYKQSPNIKKQVIDTLLLAQAYFDNNTLSINTRYYDVYLPFSEIIAIETIKRTKKLVVYTKDSRYEFYSTLKSVYKKLDKRFAYISNTCIANREKIKFKDKRKKQIIFSNGLKISYTKIGVKNGC